jgi:hypothetical protein
LEGGARLFARRPPPASVYGPVRWRRSPRFPGAPPSPRARDAPPPGPRHGRSRVSSLVLAVAACCARGCGACVRVCVCAWCASGARRLHRSLGAPHDARGRVAQRARDGGDGTQRVRGEQR